MSHGRKVHGERPVNETQEHACIEIIVRRAAFLKKRAQLLKRYAGKFVALYRGSVVDHGCDDEELAGRMYERFGDAPFYVGKVQAGLPVYELPSPNTSR